MLRTHRPWSDGHKVSYVPLHQGGPVEGWIGGEPTHSSVQQVSDMWLPVELVPHFVHPQVCVRMTYNGEVLTSCPLYDAPCLSRISIIVARNTNGWQQGAELAQKIFPHQADDVVVDVVERDGVTYVNGKKEALLISLGGVWAPNPTHQVGVPIPQIGQGGRQNAHVRVKKLPEQSLGSWIRKDGLKIIRQGKVWVLDDIENMQHPYCRLHLRVAAS